MADSDFDRRVHAVRRFNRFYTGQIGLLHYQGLLKSPFSLAEVRVLYELAHRDDPTASMLARDLTLDPGYLSRILRDFARRGLVDKRRSERDGRNHHLRLTRKGRAVFAPLERRQHAKVAALLRELPPSAQGRLVGAMRTIETVLGGKLAGNAPYVLRPHRPGDMGWVIERHGALYAEEYGWDQTFEALVAEIAAKFIRDFDPRRERCWIAELDGVNVGSVFLVRESDDVAKLRLLIVDPKARGLGIGKRLVEECMRFARQCGYKKITLWTNDVLHAARAVYESLGFQCVKREPHHSFGKDLVGETWEIAL